MPKLPITFESQAHASADFQTPWSITSGESRSLCAVPPEFDGAGGGFSPEDLFLQALINCFVGTFKVYAKASRILFTEIYVTGQLTVDQDENRKTLMKAATLKIKITGADRPDRVETLVQKVMRDGFILNSVKTQIDYQLNVEGMSLENPL